MDSAEVDKLIQKANNRFSDKRHTAKYSKQLPYKEKDAYGQGYSEGWDEALETVRKLLKENYSKGEIIAFMSKK